MTSESDSFLGASSPSVSQVSAPPAAVKIKHHHEVLILIQTTLTFLVGALFVVTFIAQPYRIPSGSMEDTLLIGDFLLVNKVVFATPGPWKPLLAYEPVKHDDIVVFHYPIDASMYLVKRVVGVPADELHLHHGLVYLDGRLQREPYALYIPSYANAFRDEFPTSTYTDPGVSSRWWMQMQRNIHQANWRSQRDNILSWAIIEMTAWTVVTGDWFRIRTLLENRFWFIFQLSPQADRKSRVLPVIDWPTNTVGGTDWLGQLAGAVFFT